MFVFSRKATFLPLMFFKLINSVTKVISFLILNLFCLSASSQSNSALITGKVVDESGQPLQNVEIINIQTSSSVFTDNNGEFKFPVPTNIPVTLTFSREAYQSTQKTFSLHKNEERHIIVELLRGSKMLENILIKDEGERKEAGAIRLSPKSAATLPSATGGVEGLLKILVGSNNELTSRYAVRGGNYDENLIYINDFEIYRPFLIRSGQQEGLSFINPDLIKNIRFFSGGFQAKYGDKISSALDIQYKVPVEFSASAYVSLLEQGVHVEGISKDKKFTWLMGARSKTNKSLLSSQDTKGTYVPSASDLQAFMTWQISAKSQLALLAILSRSEFDFVPETAQKTAAVYTPFFVKNVGLDIVFDGHEADKYRNSLLGLRFENKVNNKLNLKWLLSSYTDTEAENFDIAGAYLLGERELNAGSHDFGKIINPFGQGVFQQYARNKLNILVLQASHKGSYKHKSHYLQWGAGVEQTHIKDNLWEWEYIDSAGYSLPFDPPEIHLQNVLVSKANLEFQTLKGYLQDNILLSKGLSLQGGVRLNYQTLNEELIISPRAQISYTPAGVTDIIFKAAAGMYSQPPFYREMRRPGGTINQHLKSQKSIQYVVGFDYNFPRKNRPTRISTEIYYKSLWDVVSYDLDNVRISYSGKNDAVAWAAGIETRLFTELVKDAESWVSIGIGRTEENLKNDFYYDYVNASGEIITIASSDKKIADSIKQEPGYVRRPSDRLLTIGLFLQDYLTTNKNFKMHLNMIYGSNMSYNIPDNPKYRNALIVDPYIRVDLGLSAQLLGPQTELRSHSPFKSFKSIWAALEIYNVIDRANTISYQLIKDYSNNTFSLPNRLTPRQLNMKIRVEF